MTYARVGSNPPSEPAPHGTSIRHQSALVPQGIDEPDQIRRRGDEAKQALPTQAAQQSGQETGGEGGFPLSVGLATGLDRRVAGVIEDERVPPDRIDLTLRRDHGGERVPCQLVGGPEGTGLVISIRRPGEQPRQMVSVSDADRRQRAAVTPPRLGPIATVAMLRVIVGVAGPQTGTRAAAELGLGELAFDGDLPIRSAQQHVDRGRARLSQGVDLVLKAECPTLAVGKERRPRPA